MLPLFLYASTKPGDHVVCGCVLDDCATRCIRIVLDSAFAARVVEADTHDIICTTGRFTERQILLGTLILQPMQTAQGQL